MFSKHYAIKDETENVLYLTITIIAIGNAMPMELIFQFCKNTMIYLSFNELANLDLLKMPNRKCVLYPRNDMLNVMVNARLK